MLNSWPNLSSSTCFLPSGLFWNKPQILCHFIHGCTFLEEDFLMNFFNANKKIKIKAWKKRKCRISHWVSWLCFSFRICWYSPWYLLPLQCKPAVSRSRSSSLSLTVESALESFDFLNTSDFDEEEDGDEVCNVGGGADSVFSDTETEKNR